MEISTSVDKIQHKGYIRYFGLWDWWIASFSVEDRDYLTGNFSFFGMGISVDLNAQVMKDKVNLLEEEVIEHTRKSLLVFLSELLSYCNINKYPRAHKTIIEKIKQHIICISSGIEIDLERFDGDKYYAAWFFSRDSFFHDLKQNDSIPSIRRLEVLWDSLDDSISPKSCINLDGNIYSVDSKKFINLCQSHWKKPKTGCRCGLIFL